MSKLFSILILIFLTGTLLASGYIFTDCAANPETNRVEITWVTVSEEKVHEFIILRGRDTDSYMELDRLSPKGPGSRYSYIDDEVMFRSVHVTYYKIRAVDENGNILEEQSLSVIPNVSGVFRTWGAIKAMFR
jgi:hypothetical protein